MALKKYMGKFTVFIVLSLVMLSMTAMASGEMTASRTLSDNNVDAGDSFEVSIVLVANQDVAAPAFYEDLPVGWVVARVNDDALIYNAEDVEWIWGEKLLAGTEKTVVYEVTVPSTEDAGTYHLTGTVSAYNVSSIAVSGDGTVTVIGSSSTSSTSSTSSDHSSMAESSTTSMETSSEDVVDVVEYDGINKDTIIESESAEEVATDDVSLDDVSLSDEANQDSEPATPGFELIFAVAGLLMCVCLFKRY